MYNRFRKSLSLIMAVVLVALLLPAGVLTAQAAEAKPEGYVLFEENFDGYSSYSEFKSKYSSLISGDNGQMSIVDGNLVITNPGQDANYNFDMTFDAKIPVLASEDVTPAIKVDYVISTDNAKFYMTVPAAYGVDDTSKATNVNSTLRHTNDGYISGLNEVSTSISNTINPKASKSGLSSITIRIGLRQPSKADYTAVNGATVTVESVKVSLIYKVTSGKTMNAALVQSCATVDGGYVQLVNDVTMDAGALNMGQNAILDLNGHTLTLPEGSKWNAPTGAVVVDSSEGKTGTIVCAAADQLNITNPSNPQLPIWTGSGYCFIEPQLIPDIHIMFTEKSAEGFTLHFRPGLGYVNNGATTVRTSYVAGKADHGLTMDARLDWVDMSGKEGHSEDKGLDEMLNKMYATDNARGVLAVTGTQKYLSISLTITLRSGNVVWELPAFTYENDYVDVHYMQGFENTTGAVIAINNNTNKKAFGYYPNGNTPLSNVTAEGKLDVAEAGSFVIPTAYPVGEKKTMVIEFDAEVSYKFAIHVRDTSNTRYQLVSFGGHDNAPFNLADLPRTSHIRLEINMNTGVVKAYENGNQLLTKNGSDTNTIATTLNATYLYLTTDNAAAGNILLDNLMIYSYDNAQ